jgi:Asp-tRNA(Asn)/Glu-tRNA(Gln) amidotransferase C subunit
LVSAIDLKIKEVEQFAHTKSTPGTTSSLKSQIENLLKLVDSAKNWNIPEPKLKADFHSSLPSIRSHVVTAGNKIASPSTALTHLFGARHVAVKRSHLKFGEIE